MEPLYHAIALRMEHSCCKCRDPKRRADSGPDGGGKLCALSEVRTAGTPNLEIQVDRKVWAQDSVEIVLIGVTPDHQVVQSIIVRR